MARFSGTATPNVDTPLILQLQSNTSGAGSYVSLFAIKADSQTDSGTVSRPVLYRPSAPGAPTAQSPEVRGRTPNDAPSAVFASSFTVAPSVIALSTGTFPLPIRISWMVNPLEGVIATNGGALVLTALASSGAGWSGNMSWEEL